MRPRALALLLLMSGLPGPTAQAGEVVQLWDLEEDDGGFISTGDLPQWEWGQPMDGPPGAWSGTRVWGTDLDDRYLRENQNELQLPAWDLTLIDEPVLVLWSWLDLAKGDAARFEVDEGAGWQVADPVYGYDGEDSLVDADLGWTPIYLDLGGLDDLSQVRLVLESDAGRAWGWYVDDVGVYTADAVPPRIDQVDAPETWSRFDLGPTITARIQDDLALTSISVLWSTDTVELTRTGFSPNHDGSWTATLPALPPGTLWWVVEASDGENLSTWPATGPQALTIALPAPQDLTGPEGRLWGTTVPLSWTAPDALDPVLGYRVYRDGLLVAEPELTATQAPAVGPTDTFQVTAWFRTPLGDFEGQAAGPLSVEVAVPTLMELSPDQAWPEDQLRVALSGQNLLLDGQTLAAADLDLGEGVTVTDVEVEHVDRAVFTVQVDPDAPPGVRDAVLDLDGLPLTLAQAFTVRDDQDRPALLSISPDALEQGARETLILTLNTAPAAVPSLDLGEELVVESVELDGLEVIVQVAVGNAAPSGSRDVTLDDGVRILVLEDGFRVWPRTVDLATDCACQGAAGPGPWVALIASLAGLCRRRRRRVPSPD